MAPASLYAAFDVFPQAKGSSSHIASMVEAMARNFGSVRLLCLGRPDMPGYQREGRIDIFRFRERHSHLLSRATAFAGFVARHARGLAGKVKLAAFRDPWGGYPLLRAHPGCPMLFEVNALPTWELEYSRPELTANTALMAKLGDMERRCLRDCSRILCVSTVTKRALMAEGVREAKIEVIPNAAHPVFFEARAQRCAIERLEEGRWFGYIGGLQPWQGVEGLIDAFALAAADLPDCRLLILHGDTRRSLREIERRIARDSLRGRVLLHAALAPTDMAGVLARVRFTAVPLADTPRNTHQGCCPIKMVESMAAGTAIVASDLAVCREWISHEQEGLLAPPGDQRAWALAIRRMFDDDVLRERMGQGARNQAQRHFAWQAVHAGLDGLFERTKVSS